MHTEIVVLKEVVISLHPEIVAFYRGRCFLHLEIFALLGAKVHCILT
jgi:hypothetical protein